jgi:hypothetical protein
LFLSFLLLPFFFLSFLRLHQSCGLDCLTN